MLHDLAVLPENVYKMDETSFDHLAHISFADRALLQRLSQRIMRQG